MYKPSPWNDTDSNVSMLREIETNDEVKIFVYDESLTTTNTCNDRNKANSPIGSVKTANTCNKSLYIDDDDDILIDLTNFGDNKENSSPISKKRTATKFSSVNICLNSDNDASDIGIVPENISKSQWRNRPKTFGKHEDHNKSVVNSHIQIDNGFTLINLKPLDETKTNFDKTIYHTINIVDQPTSSLNCNLQRNIGQEYKDEAHLVIKTSQTIRKDSNDPDANTDEIQIDDGYTVIELEQKPISPTTSLNCSLKKAICQDYEDDAHLVSETSKLVRKDRNNDGTQIPDGSTVNLKR